jgi:hypothetical protein
MPTDFHLYHELRGILGTDYQSLWNSSAGANFAQIIVAFIVSIYATAPAVSEINFQHDKFIFVSF